MDSDYKPRSRVGKVAYWKWQFVRRNPEYEKDWRNIMRVLSDGSISISDALGVDINDMSETLEISRCLKDGKNESFHHLSEYDNFKDRLNKSNRAFAKKWDSRLIIQLCPDGISLPMSPKFDEGHSLFFKDSEMVRTLEDRFFDLILGQKKLAPSVITKALFPSLPNLAKTMKKNIQSSYQSELDRLERKVGHHRINIHSPKNIEEFCQKHLVDTFIRVKAGQVIVAQSTEYLHFKVPLNQPTSESLAQIKETLSDYRKIRKRLYPIKRRPRFENYAMYVKVYDLKTEGKKWPQIVEEVFGDEISEDARENKHHLRVRIQELTEKAIDNYNRAKALIEGGWREIR